LSTALPTASPHLVTFTPDSLYSGQVILRLSAADACSEVTDDVHIFIVPSVNTITAIDDSAATAAAVQITIPVLSNDEAVNDNAVFLCTDDAITVLPQHGTVTVLQHGILLYIPQTGFSGRDSFQYQLCTDTAEVSACANQRAHAWVYISIVNEDCIIPNTFTPNGDGINDVFVLPCPGNAANFTVYNNWGVELFTDPDYHNHWDGNYKGSPLPEGTYYYTLSYRDTENRFIQKAGFISLRR
jgi:gliding motility-associated-like protein